MKSARYNVQAAAAMAGITPTVLRAWEARYGVVEPDRAASGHRRYREADVQRLQKIASLVRRGHAISELASLSDDTLEELLRADSTEQLSAQTTLFPSHIQKHFDQLMASLEVFTIQRIIMEVKWLATILGVHEFINKVAIPLFARLGELVEEDRISVAQEHALSAVMRDQLGNIMRSLQALSLFSDEQASSRAVFASPEGDLHEFGILMGAALATYYDIPIYYAGPNLPAQSLHEAAKAIDADLIVLANTPVPAMNRRIPFETYLLDIDERLDPRVEIWVGGRGDRPRLSLPSGRPFQYLNSLQELDYLLKERSLPRGEGRE